MLRPYAERYGADSSCCDNCCRCKCGWDEGEYVREDQEAARRPKEGLAGAAGGDAAPPAYKAQEPMVVPSSAEAPPPIEVPTAPTPVTQPVGDGVAAAR
jgi:hypothetical protein